MFFYKHYNKNTPAKSQFKLWSGLKYLHVIKLYSESTVQSPIWKQNMQIVA